MILCLNANAAIDKTTRISPFRLNQIHRTGDVLALPGGKGCNVARALKTLGESALVSGWVGGFAGQFIEAGLRAEGIQTAFVQTEAESRTCLSIIDAENDTLTEIYERGAPIPADRLDALKARFHELVGGCTAVALSGSLPAGVPETFYAELIVDARAANVPVLLDASGEALRLGLAAGPALIKPNKHEFVDLVGSTPSSLARFADAAVALSTRYATRVVLSLGADGALAVDGRDVLHARPPDLTIVSAVGSGDSLLAALARGTARALTVDAMLADGVAAGTANALQIGAGRMSIEDFDRVRAGVTVERLSRSKVRPRL